MKTDKSKILIVEDEIIVAMDIENCLLSFGYEVTGRASSGKEALSLIENNPPHLVLMDIVIEGDIDGIGVAAIIRQRHNIPIVFLTAFTDDVTFARARDTEPFGYLVKPFEEHALRSCIELAIFKHQQEKMLTHSKMLFFTMLKSMGDAVIAVDNEMRVTFINPAAAYLAGYDEKDCIGRPVTEIARIRDAAADIRLQDLMNKAINEGVTSRIVSGTLRNGCEVDVPIGDSVAPIKDAAGNIIGAILIFQDMTAQRDAESKIRRDNVNLKRSNENLKRFASLASHDMREPLRKVMNFGELLRKKYENVLDEQGKSYLERMHSATLRMDGYLNSALELARVDSASMSKKNVDLREVASIVVSDLEMRIRECRGRVEVASLPVLSAADHVQMCQLFQNLICNALKYHKPDIPPVVQVSAVSIIDRGNWWKIVVADNGIGMAEKNLERIFEPFERLQEDEKVEGLGLGLAICAKIAALHGGKIYAQSELGKGSVFYVELPA